LTTLEAWWHGVPTITLSGETFLHNQSMSVMRQLGQEDLICGSIDQYVARAVALAADKQRRRHLRATCRTALEATIIRQPAAAAKGVISGIERCWADWCDSRQALAARLA
jgi:predicted O-linked N-acetylglucosamine transferase (SPINDLY family)